MQACLLTIASFLHVYFLMYFLMLEDACRIFNWLIYLTNSYHWGLVSFFLFFFHPSTALQWASLKISTLTYILSTYSYKWKSWVKVQIFLRHTNTYYIMYYTVIQITWCGTQRYRLHDAVHRLHDVLHSDTYYKLPSWEAVLSLPAALPLPALVVRCLYGSGNHAMYDIASRCTFW